ncbi:MAG: oxidoreductase [Deltaproteobacteria bacterium]|nr:oxidoreductase [Deltaproteobacteria bacterium]
MPSSLPKLAVFKFTSCDGCQLSLLDLEDELLAIAGRIRLAYFPEATRSVLKGPYDVALVEGSVSTPEELERVQQVRRSARFLVAIGACATSGGIQALRNFADVDEFKAVVYAKPHYLEALAESTPIAQHVKVDLELQGCPISKTQLLTVLTALLQGREPRLPSYSVCLECKRRGNICVLTGRGLPCLGPLTRAGCGALCPGYHRPCYGCFGPQETPNPASLSRWFKERLGLTEDDLVRALRQFTANAPAFRQESVTHEH